MQHPVLLLQLGEAIESVRAVHGSYADWYLGAWGAPMQVRGGRPGGRHPDPRDFAGIVITGSARSLVTPEPWMDDAADFVQRAADAGVPTLGVCFGHQLIGQVAGGSVVRNPKGWEIGTHEVELTEAGKRDPLFTDCPPVVRVNLSHEDMVGPAGGFTLLAHNGRSPVQALAWGEHVRGIQFHPEFSGEVTRGYVRARRDLLGDQDAGALERQTVDSPDGVRIMRNFRRFWVEPRARIA